MRVVQMRAVAIAAAAAILVATPAGAQTATYKVGAYDDQEIALTLCNPHVRVEVRGDGDTDLDFTITDPSGAIIHSDLDDTDWTMAVVRNGDNECREYNLYVQNFGSVYNEFSVVMRNIDTASGDGRDRTVALRNRTGESIYYIFWSNTGDDSWREDRLGSDVLLDEEEWKVSVDDGSGACRYDFRARTGSSREIVRKNIDVCVEAAVYFR